MLCCKRTNYLISFGDSFSLHDDAMAMVIMIVLGPSSWWSVHDIIVQSCIISQWCGQRLKQKYREAEDDNDEA